MWSFPGNFTKTDSEDDFCSGCRNISVTQMIIIIIYVLITDISLNLFICSKIQDTVKMPGKHSCFMGCHYKMCASAQLVLFQKLRFWGGGREGEDTSH